MSKIKIFPKYKPANLHNMASIISFENAFNIRKIYKEVVGMDYIDHVSINIVNSQGKMLIFSVNPQIAYSIIKDGSYIFNGSISPDFYTKKQFYTWEDGYDPQCFNEIKAKLQLKNNIDMGCVIVKKIEKFYILFSFAKKNKGLILKEAILDNKNYYYNIGMFLLTRINNIYINYCEKNEDYLNLTNILSSSKIQTI